MCDVTQSRAWRDWLTGVKWLDIYEGRDWQVSNDWTWHLQMTGHDTTYQMTRHDTFKWLDMTPRPVKWLDMTPSYMSRHDTFKWLNMTPSYESRHVTHGHLWRDSFTCVAWLKPWWVWRYRCISTARLVSDLTPSFLWHDSFIRDTRLILMTLHIHTCDTQILMTSYLVSLKPSHDYIYLLMTTHTFSWLHTSWVWRKNM